MMSYLTEASTATDPLALRPIHIRIVGKPPAAAIWEDGAWRHWPGALALDAVGTREAVEAQLQAILTRPAPPIAEDIQGIREPSSEDDGSR